ncbi:MAG: penicillin-binding protein 1B [Pseudomonadota bacterium]
MAKRAKSRTSARSKSRAGRSNNKKNSSPSIWRRLFKFGWYASLLIAVGIAGYLVYLDRTITKTFEGRRWSVPAQVYAQPLELYPGAQITADSLQTELQRLGYRADADLRTSGTYKYRSGELQIYLREFHFMERKREAQRISLRFDDSSIRDISNARGQVPLVRLDPATIGSFFPTHGEDRLILTPDEVPPLLGQGLKAIEDRNFDKHIGFSIRGIIRAFVVNLRAGETQQGGSTLTQQLVKSYFLDNRQTIERKLKEVAMAFILDARFTKDDLLTAYVNEIFLGQNGTRAIHGFGLGAQFYFNKPLTELDPDEIATLISIIRGPSYYNPFRHPQRALERRNRILTTLHRDNLIDQATLELAIGQPLGVVASPTSGGAYYPAFMDKVRSELSELYDRDSLSSEGLRVFTTIQPYRQERAQQALSSSLNSLEKARQIETGKLQGAAIIADSQTGEIVALVGGRKGRVDGFNRALSAQRSVGSLIKPVVFLSALENGLHLASIVPDEPITITPDNGQPWTPKNFDGQYRGELPLVRALAQSLNLATVHLGTQIGLETIQDRFEHLIGRPAQNPYPSFLLGAESLAPIEMLRLYGNFASGGFRTEPKAVIAVLNDRGEPLSHHPFELEQTVSLENVAAINRALEIVMAKGTGRSSPYARRGIAGKTGTSNDNRDSWFAGFDNRYVSVVWIGRDDNKITGLTGSTGALQVWNAMNTSSDLEPLQHPAAGELVEVEFETGRRAKASCAEVVRIPVPDLLDLPIKPGCGIKTPMKDRLRRWFSNAN